MAHHEPWLTALFNQHLAGVANSALALIGVHPHDPAHPWTTPMTMQLLVVAIIVVVFGALKSRLSMDRPGKFQQLFELMYQFIHGQAEENIGHGARKYMALCGTIFIFVLFANLLGVIPTFESPTMFPEVPAGIAILTFGYYNLMGIMANGIGKYLAHFAGPIPLMAPLMIPIELVSHMARPMSLTIRLYANMFAGEQVTVVFLKLTFLVMPAVFMGMHVFVSFLQAYIFMLMTMVYLSGAVAHDEAH